MLTKTISLVTTAALLSACAALPARSQYGYQDVGHAAIVQFGTVVSERPVQITGQTTGVGAAAGVGGGALAGSYIGRGGGSLAGALAGALIAGIAGAAAEQAMADHQGIEYTITLESGVTVSIVQNLTKDEDPINVGHRVTVQTSGMYQRVLPADDLPEEIKKPKSIRVRG